MIDMKNSAALVLAAFSLQAAVAAPAAPAPAATPPAPRFAAPVPAPVPNLAPNTGTAKGAAASARPPLAGAQSGNRGKRATDDMECMIEPSLVVNVGSPVEGTIDRVLVDRGANVRRGQVLARLNSEVEEATLTLRQAQEAYGQRKVVRNAELFKKELISASEKDELETQTRLASLERKQQQAVLNLRTITSPVNGVVVERYLSPGDHISQEKIMKIAQIDPLNVEVIVPVELFGTIRNGMAGKVSIGALGGAAYDAQVTVVDRVIDAASGTFGVRLQLRNPGNKISAGLRCNVRFTAR